MHTPFAAIAPTSPVRRPARTRRAPWLAASAFVAIAAVIGAVVANRPRATNPPGPAPGPPPMITVPFDGQSYRQQWADHLGLPAEIEADLGIKARLIPPGRFWMGTPEDEIERRQAVEPNPHVRERIAGVARRFVTLPAPFYLTATEVTVGQFRRFAEGQPYRTWAERDGRGYRLKGGKWAIERGHSWRDPGPDQPLTDGHPVGNLCRDDGVALCQWLTVRSGGRYRYRLPTEAEWEYACRAGSDGAWCCGSSERDLGLHAWFAENAGMIDGCVRPVAGRRTNAFGLFDTHGNVAEWCDDKEGRAVVRGGTVSDPAGNLRSAARQPSHPRAPDGGLRLLIEPAEASR